MCEIAGGDLLFSGNLTGSWAQGSGMIWRGGLAGGSRRPKPGGIHNGFTLLHGINEHNNVRLLNPDKKNN